MAATGPRSALTIAALLIALALPIQSNDSSGLRRRLSDVASALSAGNATQAMDCFDKQSFANYDKLNSFFEGLTAAYQVDSQLDITDEEETATEASLAVHWTLTLTDPASNLDEHRDARLTIKLIRKKNNWQIAAFEPIEIFDPQTKH